MTEWIIPANGTIYDHEASFEDFGFIDWTQGKIKYEIGDIVFIYCCRPISSVRYMCKVENINMLYTDIRDDKEYWTDPQNYEASIDGYFFRLRLINQVMNGKLSLDMLKINGLKAAPQRPQRITPVLSIYLNQNFADANPEYYFPDSLSEESNIYEGVKKQITVNKYERSSIARNRCIAFHKPICSVCGMNFYDTYGEIGEGFIHVHHVYPIAEIGKEYMIDPVNDLRPVCPNCHAMLHRKINGGSVHDIEELKKGFKK